MCNTVRDFESITFAVFVLMFDPEYCLLGKQKLLFNTITHTVMKACIIKAPYCRPCRRPILPPEFETTEISN